MFARSDTEGEEGKYVEILRDRKRLLRVSICECLSCIEMCSCNYALRSAYLSNFIRKLMWTVGSDEIRRRGLYRGSRARGLLHRCVRLQQGASCDSDRRRDYTVSCCFQPQCVRIRMNPRSFSAVHAHATFAFASACCVRCKRRQRTCMSLTRVSCSSWMRARMSHRGR
jgi:hypothetical protein